MARRKRVVVVVLVRVRVLARDGQAELPELLGEEGRGEGSDLVAIHEVLQWQGSMGGGGRRGGGKG